MCNLIQKIFIFFLLFQGAKTMPFTVFVHMLLNSLFNYDIMLLEISINLSDLWLYFIH